MRERPAGVDPSADRTAEFAVDLARRATGRLTDTPYMDRLSAVLGNSWRLLRWLLARMPHIVKSRLPQSRRDAALHEATRSSGYLDKQGMPIELTDYLSVDSASLGSHFTHARSMLRAC